MYPDTAPPWLAAAILVCPAIAAGLAVVNFIRRHR